MRLPCLASLAVCLGAAPALAQPVTTPEPCSVTIARAPDDVRAEIETWVRAEPRCSTSLEVRVVATTDGALYLYARDERGRIRERVVPDAQSAGVLVASWVADDAQAQEPITVPPVVAPMPRTTVVPVPLVAVQVPIRVAAPGEAVPGVVADVAELPPRRASVGSHANWWMFGGATTIALHPAMGVRTELDLYSQGAWALGVSGSILDTTDYDEPQTTATLGLQVSRSSSWGPWHLRAQVGAGVGIVKEGHITMNYGGTFTPIPIVETGLTVGRDLNRDWQVAAGPLLSIMGVESVDQLTTAVSHDDVSLTLYAGLRRGL
jgi:hypothetical protein